MNSEAHIIDIDSIVLTGVDQRHLGNLSALIETEILRALGGAGLRTPTAIPNSEARVAGEVARTVVKSLRGGNDRV